MIGMKALSITQIARAIVVAGITICVLAACSGDHDASEPSQSAVATTESTNNSGSAQQPTSLPPLSYALDATRELGMTPYAVSQMGDSVVVVDWETGSIWQVDAESSPVAVGQLEDRSIYDFVLDGDDILYAVNSGDHIDLVRFPLGEGETTRTSLPYPAIDVGSVRGIEVLGDELVLLLDTEEGPVLYFRSLATESYPSLSRITCPVAEALCLESEDRLFLRRIRCQTEELLGLESYGGQLYAFDWPQGVIYSIDFSGGQDFVTCHAEADVASLVPPGEPASGGFRGFAIADDALFVTSIAAEDGGLGRLHRLPFETRTDPVP
ncbi:hypothetical protein ACFLSF_04280 [Candidatus Bipolaricaulota bacterium]